MITLKSQFYSGFVFIFTLVSVVRVAVEKSSKAVNAAGPNSNSSQIYNVYIHIFTSVSMFIYYNRTSWFDTGFFRTRGLGNAVIINGQAGPLGRITYGVTSLNTKVPPVTKVKLPNSGLLETGIVPLSYVNQQQGHELKPEIRENTKFWECRHFSLLHTPPTFVQLFFFFGICTENMPVTLLQHSEEENSSCSAWY